MRRAFTLVELLVVVGIILLVLAIAVPAVGPMLASNEQSAMVNTLTGLLVSAQTAAQANGTTVGLRFERAYAVNGDGVMVDAAGCTPDGELPNDANCTFQGPQWLDYQQVRLVIFMARNQAAFRQLPNSELVDLPKGAWVAPSYVLNFPGLNEANLSFRYDSTRAWRTYNRMDTFFITFGPDGELSSSPAGSNWYIETRQSEYSDRPVAIRSADASAMSLLVYDRKEFQNFDESTDPTGTLRLNYLQREARPVYINRATGSLIEERP